MHGAGHERNRRAGTENTIEIAGLGRACSLIQRQSGKVHGTHVDDAQSTGSGAHGEVA